MAAATRAHAAESGIDLRRFNLIAFGGAGPVHAYAIANKLGIRRVLCPLGAGVASAIGCLVAPPAIDLVSAYEGELDRLNWALVSREYDEMRRQGEAALGALVGGDTASSLHASLDMRCQGQGYSITISTGENPAFDRPTAMLLTTQFNAQYEKIYGHVPPAVPLEVVALRARICLPRNTMEIGAHASRDGSQTGPGKRPTRNAVQWDGAALEGVVYDRYALSEGDGEDPRVIEERETSIIIDRILHVDAHRESSSN